MNLYLFGHYVDLKNLSVATNEKIPKKLISTFTNVQMNINFKMSKLFLNISNL